MGAKRLTTLANFTGLTGQPGADTDFFVDGDRAVVSINIFDITGTTPTIGGTVVELVSKEWSLPYDGQTSNFTVGATLTGYPTTGGGSPATGVIMNDTDGGASGTLLLSSVVGKFEDNMVIRDDNGTPGVAVVNSATGGSRTWAEGDVWATFAQAAVDAAEQLLNPNLSDSSGTIIPVSLPIWICLLIYYSKVVNERI
jgi:hypothetical protein